MKTRQDRTEQISEGLQIKRKVALIDWYKRESRDRIARQRRRYRKRKVKIEFVSKLSSDISYI